MASFLDSIRNLFRADEPQDPASRPTPASTDETSVDPVHLAACALLLEVAWADGEFSEAEQRHLEAVLERHFALPPESGRALIALADEERRRAIDHFGFTSILRSRYDLGQKMVLAEVMWGLVLADGTIAEHEHYLTRKIANLLDLEPGYLAHAKLAAAQRVAGRTPPDES